MYPIPDKHNANTHAHMVHTTRRAQVLGQDVSDFIPSKHEGRGLTSQERVFIRSTPKPIEMCQTFSDSLIGGENSYNMFLKQDPNKAVVFNNFKNLSRDLTKAFLR